MKKKTLAAILLASTASFALGAYSSDELGDFMKPKEVLVQEGFYQNPYDLKIVYKEVDGKTETYLIDKKTGHYVPIFENFSQRPNSKKEVAEVFLKIFYIVNFF